uniref:signal-recognition-particle GTPase n=1 Tax=Pseudo-nitzschia australis TaxID=44445 RepID=A0A7S4ER55_9STRA|mmetsp:Transcript_9545/g.20645  ORF Transcript_9545/g.20645 Transcript_9545/m.20645 type:complete len:579 (+) Transcript_9545:181-1917(+)
MRFFRASLVTALSLASLQTSTAFTPRHALLKQSSSAFTGRSSAALVERRQDRASPQLSMMFDQLSNAISTVVKDFGKQRVTEESIKPALRSVRRALLDADVNIDVADALIDGVKKRSLGETVIEGVSADQQFIKAMYDELVDMMGGDSSAKSDNSAMGPVALAPPASTVALGTPENPAVVLLAGLQGAGKTTAAGKLALYLKEREVDYSVDLDDIEEENRTAARLPKRNRKVLLAAADVYRPAAIAQLEILGKSVDVEVFSMGTEADPVDIAQKALEKAKAEGFDTLIVDTAGRQIIDDDLMGELQRIKETVKPDETLLVVDAMTGQEAASLTAAFDSAVGLTGAILTKMDGDSRGGAAVSVRGVSGKPIKFVGTGERTPDLEPFYPDRMASRILGMGDVLSIVEKAQEEMTDKEAKLMEEKVKNAEFDFDDFLKQAKMVSKMGNLGGVAKMMPGMGGVSTEQLIAAEKRLKKNEAMITVMTEEERKNPDLLIKDSKARERMERIAKFSELPIQDVRQFMSEFQKMRTMMSRMSKASDKMNPAMAGGEGDGPMPGNRAARRAAKKQKKGGRGGGGGFG